MDWLSKMWHFVPYYVSDKGTLAEEMARMFLESIFKLHGLPSSVVLDRGSQFVSAF